ncbi:Crp/Fnr family transcriptional regulator [Fundidesulfovibrio terrae]|uniref:Crp/Fnr family transcriptional regulator n=1 Tax=Fundidesulfovibrio terrae TaxID=2922866 RepID=UPI001FAEFFA5|nr:cyclic nucleotide-binding domain-containing protein [Fundidesulfovibrio terrae]
MDHTAFAKHFTWDELCLLSGFMTYQSLYPGDFLFEEGDPGTFTGILLRGVVSVVKGAPDGGSALVCDIHKGHAVGEQALLDREPRSASIIAQTPVTLLILRREAFDMIVNNHPRLGMKLMGALACEMSARLRMVTGRLACDRRFRVPERDLFVQRESEVEE